MQDSQETVHNRIIQSACGENQEGVAKRSVQADLVEPIGPSITTSGHDQVMKESSEIRLANMAALIKTSLTPGEIARLILIVQPVPSTGQMTPEEFDDLMRAIEASKGTRMFTEKSVSAARLILVMGATPIEAAKELGMTKQAVGQALKRIKLKAAEQPKGWSIVNEYLPAELASAVREIGKSLRRVVPTTMKGPMSDSQRHELSVAGDKLKRALQSVGVENRCDSESRSELSPIQHSN